MYPHNVGPFEPYTQISSIFLEMLIFSRLAFSFQRIAPVSDFLHFSKFYVVIIYRTMYLRSFFFIGLLVALHSIVSAVKPPQYFRFRRYGNGAMREFNSAPVGRKRIEIKHFQEMKGFLVRQSPVMYMGIGKK